MAVNLAVVPVAGRGSRLLPLTKSQPKEMLPVGRKPVVQYVVEELARCGIDRLLFITGPGKAAIENHFDIDAELIGSLRESGKEELLQELAFEREDVEYCYTRQRRQLGLGHAVLCAGPMVGQQPFVVALGDSIIGRHGQSNVVRTMIETFESTKADGVIALLEVPPEGSGSLWHRRAAGQGRRRLRVGRSRREARAVPRRPATWPLPPAMSSVPPFSTASKRTRPGKANEIQLTDAIHMLIREGGKVMGVRLSPEERRFDIGYFESYFVAFLEFALSDPQYGEALRTRLKRLLAEG